MVSAIGKAAAEGSLLSKLADAREPFWSAVADALVVIAADLLLRRRDLQPFLDAIGLSP